MLRGVWEASSSLSRIRVPAPCAMSRNYKNRTGLRPLIPGIESAIDDGATGAAVWCTEMAWPLGECCLRMWSVIVNPNPPSPWLAGRWSRPTALASYVSGCVLPYKMGLGMVVKYCRIASWHDGSRRRKVTGIKLSTYVPIVKLHCKCKYVRS